MLRHLIQNTLYYVTNLDKLTYAGNLETLASTTDSLCYRFYQIDICDGAALDVALAKFQSTAVMHFAAESHVDRSIDAPSDFIQINIVGTYCLLEATRSYSYWNGLKLAAKAAFRFHYMSTDEVYGGKGTNRRWISTPTHPLVVSLWASN